MLTTSLLLWSAAALQINHPTVDCMLADKFPQLEAVIEPTADVSDARVYFRSAREQEFHYVPMGLQLGRFVAKLPKPKSKSGPITYYVEATDADGASRRTPPLAAAVADRTDGCPRGGRVAEMAADGSVLVFATGDKTSKPDGFSGVSDVKRASGPGVRVAAGSAVPPSPRPSPSASPSPPRGGKASTDAARKEEARKKDEEKKAADRKKEEDRKREEDRKKEEARKKDEEKKAADRRAESGVKPSGDKNKKTSDPKESSAKGAPRPGPSPSAPPPGRTAAGAPAAPPAGAPRPWVPPTAGSYPVAGTVAPGEQGTSGTVADYLIGPEDVLKVTVYGNDDLTQTIVVQADGTFMFPLIGQVKAADYTPRDIGKKITYLLSQGFVRNPQVSVTVAEYHSKNIFVLGEVSKPGSYPLQASGNNSLVEVISKAGPMTSNAGQEVLVIRPKDRSIEGPTLLSDVTGAAPKRLAEVIRVNLSEIQQGHLEKNIDLQPDDTVYVPQATKVFVSGEVRNPGAYPFVAGTTVRQALSLAGGLTDRGSPSRVRVVRDAGNGKTREDKARLEDVVQPGDTILVKEKLF